MFSIYLVNLKSSIEKVIEVKRGGFVVFIRPEYVCVPRFLEYAFLQAYKTYGSDKNVAKTLELEWLCKIALTNNVASALSSTRPDSKTAVIAAVNCFENLSELSSFSEIITEADKSLLKTAPAFLAEKYSLTKEALEHYSLEDLLIEKAAVENL